MPDALKTILVITKKGTHVFWYLRVGDTGQPGAVVPQYWLKDSKLSASSLNDILLLHNAKYPKAKVHCMVQFEGEKAETDEDVLDAIRDEAPMQVNIE